MASDEKHLQEIDRAALERWYEERGSRDIGSATLAVFGQPLPALPIAGHNRCRVAGCDGYTRNGTVCVDHFPRSVS